MKNNFKRCLALLMALMMIVGAFAIPVSAADSDCEHEYEEIVKAPTCTTVGYTTYICKLCDDSKIENIVAKLSHNWVKQDKGVDSNCTESGYVAGAEVCSVCNEVKDPSHVIDPKDNPNLKDHVWDESKTRVDGDLCSDNGVVITYKTCKLCKKEFVYDEKTNVGGGHDYKYEIVTPATCSADGKAVKTCKVCGDKVEIKILKLSHPGETEWKYVKDFNAKVNGTTYKADATHCVMVKYCTECGIPVKAQYAANTTHNYEYTSDFADVCKNPGYRMQKCKDCGFENKQKFTEEHNLNYNDPKEVVKGVHKVDKLVEGYSVYVCLTCGEDVKIIEAGYENAADWHTPEHKNSILKLDQSNAGFWVAPKCTEVGYGRYVCDCGFETVASIKATGHSYGTAVKEAERCDREFYTKETCTVCGHENIKQTHKPVTNHKKDTLLAEKAATCFAEGYKKYGCALCTTKDSPIGYVIETKTFAKLTCDAKKYVVTDNGETGCFVKRVITTTCPTCNGVKVEEELFNSHQYNTEKVILKATCNTTGQYGYICERKNCNGDKCGATEITMTLDFDKTNHTGGKVGELSKKEYKGAYATVALEEGKLADVTAAKLGSKEAYNCYKVSYTWWYCEGCDKEFEQVTTYKHTDGKTYTAGSGVHAYNVTYTSKGDKMPTCTTTGIATLVCEICDFTKKGEIIDKTGHDIKNATVLHTVASNCSALGYKVYECKTCKASVTVSETKYGDHSYDAGKQTTAPTCAAKGVWTQTCTICGGTKTSDIAKVPHGTMKVVVNKKDTYYTTIEYKAPECGVAGYDEHYKCAKCGKFYIADATDNTKDQKEISGATDKKVAIAALKHAAEATGDNVPNSCVDYGYDTFDCVNCGVELEWHNFVDPDGHVAITEVKNNKTVNKEYSRKATCYAYAYKCNVCSICGVDFNIVDDKTQTRPPHINKDGYPLIGDCRIILGNENCKVCKGTGVDCADCAVYYTCANKKADGKTVCNTVIPAQCAFVNPVEYEECNAIVSECKFCGKTHTDKIDATEDYAHVYEVVVEPTIKTEGKEACKVCGAENPVAIPKLTAVVFSMEANNPNGGNIVNGGSVYVTIKIDALKIDVNNIRVAVDYDEDHLIFKGAVKSTSIFGALSEPVANAKGGVAYVFDDAGSERNNITIEGKMDFVTLEFYVKPEACDAKNRLTSLIKFIEPTGELANSVMFYDVEADKYNTYTYDVKKNEQIDLKIDQLGDFDNNGNVNNYDLVAVRDAITNGNAYDAVLDIDHDGEITIKDYKYIKEYMVATYDYWMFADLVSYNNWLAVKDNKVSANDSAKYFEWLAK